MNAIGFNLRFTGDLLARTGGESFYDNLDTIYPPAVDAIVGRFTADRRGLHYLDRFYSPSGDISFPVMTLHGTRDPVVPLFHETNYATLAPEALAGAAHGQQLRPLRHQSTGSADRVRRSGALGD